MNVRVVLFPLLCVLLFSGAVWARERTDVIVMNNGDRMTGEIRGLDSGGLAVSFAYIKGTSLLDWAEVHHLESRQLFVVKTQDGSVYTGSLSTAETDGGRPVEIRVSEEAGNTVVLQQQKIVDIYQTWDSFWRRFNGEVNSGMIYSKGNDATQFTFGGDIQYPGLRWNAGATVNSQLAVSTGSDTSTRNNGTLYYTRLARWNNWFYTGMGTYLQSSEQNIQLQGSLGGAIGHYFRNTNNANISVIGGVAWQNTRYSRYAVDQENQNTAAVLLGATVRLFKFDANNITVTARVLPSLNEPGRVFSNVNANYSLTFLGDFTWNVSFFGNWDNRPPGGFSGSDYGTSSGLGWTFGTRHRRGSSQFFGNLP